MLAFIGLAALIFEEDESTHTPNRIAMNILVKGLSKKKA